MKRFLNIVCLFCVLSFAPSAFAYPTSVKGTLSLTLNQATGGLQISSKDRYLYLAYVDNFKIVDLGTYALAADQSPALSKDDGTDGNIQALAYIPSTDLVFASQDDGDVLTYNLNAITNNPASNTIASGKSLGPMGFDTTSSPAELYMWESTSSSVYVWPAGTSNQPQTISLKDVPELATLAYKVLDVLFVESNHELYIATDVGIVVWASSSGTVGSPSIVLDDTKAADLKAMAVTPNGDKVYVADASSTPNIYSFSTSSHQKLNSTIEISTTDNTALTDIIIMEVIGGATYGFVSGARGVSVFDTATNQLIDVNTTNDGTTKTWDPIPTSQKSGPMVPSADGYIYLSDGGGDILVITENPWVTISSVTYVDSAGATATALKQGGTATIVFQSDVAGQYTVMAGGDIDRSGKSVIDINGSSTGAVPAATDTTFSFRYNDNSGSLDEGKNNIFMFVTADSNSNLEGREVAEVTVDTPPGALTIYLTGFGSQRVYITFSRLTASDMSSYTLYADTDPALVQTKTDTSGSVAQTASGDTITGIIDGLTDNTTYYLAVEGVDTAGNIGPRAYLKSDGTPASTMPQETVGPAGLSGETGGCSLVEGKQEDGNWRLKIGLYVLLIFVLVAAKLALLKCSRKACFAKLSRASSAATRFPHLSRASSAATRFPHLGRASSAATRFPHLSRASSAATLLIIILLLTVSSAHAAEETKTEENFIPKASPQWWSMEVKTGFWMPTNSTTEKFFDKCCNLVTSVNGGLLYKGRYGAEVGVGFMSKDRPALGAVTGEVSSDTFNMFLLPMETNGVWRIDYAEKQIVVPYIKAGVDYVFYREGDRGKTVKGIKTGMHATGGIQFLFPWLDTDMEYGLNGMYFIMEARYGWINSFGKKGLDLSGPVYSAGLLFEF